MPVIECSCGMVMSVAAADPRSSCIRCGGVELQTMTLRKPARCRTQQGAFPTSPELVDSKPSPVIFACMGSVPAGACPVGG
jgi:hypothetical protein